MHEPVGERAVVREEQDTGRVGIEATDGHHAALMPDDAHHRGAALRVARRRDDARGLVQDDIRERLGATSAPSTSTRSLALHEGGEPDTSPLTVTRPARISSSAPRREAMPARRGRRSGARAVIISPCPSTSR
jgi:hypothetical protein